MRILIYLYDILFRIKRETPGVVSTEYAFLFVFISLFAILGIIGLGDQLNDYFTRLGLAIAEGTPPS